MRSKITGVGIGIALSFAIVSPARAHGPCDCLSPRHAVTGTRVQVDESYNGVKVLWNPDPAELRNPALVGSGWEKFYKPRQRTIELARQDEPGAISFRIPKVPDGTYLVVIFDPSEGPDAHFTWETFEVRAGAALPDTGTSLPLTLFLAAASIGMGVILHTRPAHNR